MTAKELIQIGKYTCVVTRNGEILHALSGRGIAPLLSLYEGGTLCGTAVFDKIVGKAAAMLIADGGAAYCYAETMSAAALDFLRTNGIEAECGKCVDFIISRTGDGMCPMEEAVQGASTAKEGYIAIKNKLSQLMGGNR